MNYVSCFMVGQRAALKDSQHIVQVLSDPDGFEALRKFCSAEFNRSFDDSCALWVSYLIAFLQRERVVLEADRRPAAVASAFISCAREQPRAACVWADVNSGHTNTERHWTRQRDRVDAARSSSSDGFAWRGPS